MTDTRPGAKPLDPRGPNKATPEPHPAFPNQPNKGHGTPGDNKKGGKK